MKPIKRRIAQKNLGSKGFKPAQLGGKRMPHPMMFFFTEDGGQTRVRFKFENKHGGNQNMIRDTIRDHYVYESPQISWIL